MRARVLSSVLALALCLPACGGGGADAEDPFADEIQLAVVSVIDTLDLSAPSDRLLLCLGQGSGDNQQALTIAALDDGHSGPSPIVRASDQGPRFTRVAQALTDGRTSDFLLCAVPDGADAICGSLCDEVDFDPLVTRSGPDFAGFEVTGIRFRAIEPVDFEDGPTPTVRLRGDIEVFGRALP